MHACRRLNRFGGFNLRFVLFLLFAATAQAQDNDREAFTVEGTVAAWFLHPAGTVISNGNQIDFRTDLGISEHHTSPYIRAILKPSRKNRVVFETIPYRLNGNQQLTRSVTFNGVTYTIQDRIASEANVNYFFGGYQRDLVSNSFGHAGFLTGIGYLDGDANVRSQTRGLQGTESAKIPFPLVGGEFRVLPDPRGLFNINADVKGFPLGTYGHYFQTVVNVGVSLGHNLTAQAGYGYVNANIHEKNNGDGFKLNFRGPLLSIQFRDR
jgi:hypothetical protein